MANTLPDIKLVSGPYINLYSVSGIASGTKVIIQNKTTPPVYVQVQGSQPASTSNDGFLLIPNEFCIIDSPTISGVWVKGSGTINVQVYEG